METVNASEVAALERAAEPHAYTSDGGGLCALCQLAPAAKVHALPSHAAAAAEAELRAESSVPKGPPAASEAAGGAAPVSPVSPEPTQPKGALEQLVEQAIEARLGPIVQALQRLERRGFHTMALAMVLGDRFAISEAELKEAYEATARVEQRGAK